MNYYGSARSLMLGVASLLWSPMLTAQTVREAAPAASTGVAGTWEGRLGRSALRLVLEITRTEDSLYFARLTSVDQGGGTLRIDRLEVSGDTLRFAISSVGATYDGVLSADQSRIVGVWTQGGRARLEFTRTTPAPMTDSEPNVYAIFGVAADMRVPVPPMPFRGNGGQQIAYEIHVRNHSGVSMLLTRLEVLDDTVTLASWEGEKLHAIIKQQRPDARDNRSIPAGGWGIVYVWVTLDSAATVPKLLRHRLTVGGRSLEGTVPVMGEEPIVLSPPLRGGDWLAANGPGNMAGHRRAIVPLEGQAFIAQRYAIDWARLGPTGRLFDGDASANESYFGYGAEVLAVADGVIDVVKDGIPENVPGTTRLRTMGEGDTLRAVPMSLETIAGNYLMLDLGGGRYAFYGHLMPGSIRVKPGDRARRGDVLARLGNSGNSTGPHLHFHIADRNRPLAAEGLPYVIRSWELLRGPNTWERRTNEIPMQDARVRFPQT